MRKKRTMSLAEPALGFFCFFLAVALSFTLFAPSTEEVDTGPVVVAAVGDSNTFGTGVHDYEQDTYSYPAQLQELLGDEYEVYNYGINGAAIISSAGRPYDKDEIFEKSKEHDPNIVLIMLGTNDVRQKGWSVSNYRERLTYLVNAYKALPSQPKVYLLSPPSMFTTEQDQERIEEQVIPAVKRVAQETETIYVDVHTATDRSELYPDDLHLNALGYRILAEEVRDAIETPELN